MSNVVEGPWPDPGSPDVWRKLYLRSPNADLRAAIEIACPGALDGLDVVEEQSPEEMLAEVHALYEAVPSDELRHLIDRLEQRVEEGAV